LESSIDDDLATAMVPWLDIKADAQCQLVHKASAVRHQS